MIVPTKVKFC